MKLFNIPNPSGGHVMKAHDLNFIYDAFKDGFTALSLKHGNNVIYGLDYTRVASNIINYSSGWVMIGGEIYYYAGLGNINTTSIPDPCLVPYQVAISPSPRTAADSTTKNVHFDRYVRIENYAAQPIKYRLKELRHFGDPFHTINPFGTGSDWDFATGWTTPGVTDFEPLKVRKMDDKLEIQGVAKTTAYSNGSTILTLPSLYFGTDYKPKKIRSFPVSARSSAGSLSNHMMLIDIDPTGAVTVNSGTYSGTTDLFLFFNHEIPLMY